MPLSPFMQVSSSALCSAMDSSVARAMWARVVPRVSPTRVRARRGPSARPGRRRRRHHEHVVGVGDAGGQRLDLFRALDDAQPVAQPLHRRAGHEHAAFQHVRRFPGAGRAGIWQAPAHGGQQVVGRAHRLVANVHQHEAAGAVGVLGHAGREAGLAEGSVLLVASHAGDGDGAAQPFWQGVADHRAARRDAGQHAARDVQQRQDVIVPVLRVQVEQHGARGVAGVGAVHRAAGQLPHQPGVDGAEGQFAALGHLARAGHVVEQPGQLGAGEVRVQHQAGAGLQEIGVPVGARSRSHSGAVRRSCQTMARASGGRWRVPRSAWFRAGW